MRWWRSRGFLVREKAATAAAAGWGLAGEGVRSVRERRDEIWHLERLGVGAATVLTPVSLDSRHCIFL